MDGSLYLWKTIRLITPTEKKLKLGEEVKVCLPLVHLPPIQYFQYPVNELTQPKGHRKSGWSLTTAIILRHNCPKPKHFLTSLISPPCLLATFTSVLVELDLLMSWILTAELTTFPVERTGAKIQLINIQIHRPNG